MHCLLIMEPWTTFVLAHRQMWVLHAWGTDVRGRVGLVRCEEGVDVENHPVVGTADLVDVFIPSAKQLAKNVHRHHFSPVGLKSFGDEPIYAFVLKHVRQPMVPRSFHLKDDTAILGVA